MEAVGVGDVVDHDSHGAVPDVGRNEGSEPLLSGCVPQLKADSSILEVHRLGKEVDTDGRLVGVVETVVHESGDE